MPTHTAIIKYNICRGQTRQTLLWFERIVEVNCGIRIMVIITAFQAEDDSSILLSRSLLIIDEIMKETSFKAGVIGGLCGVFTFLALFATTSKASINESAATNGDYKINRVQYEFINELTIKEIIRTHSKQRGYEWLILVEENGNQYTPFELNGIVVKELTLEQWNQIIE